MGQQVAELAHDGQAVSFAVPAANVHYRATLVADGARMSGTWARAGSPDAEVAFVRGTQTAAGPPARPQLPRPPFPTAPRRFISPIPARRA